MDRYIYGTCERYPGWACPFSTRHSYPGIFPHEASFPSIRRSPRSSLRRGCYGCLSTIYGVALLFGLKPSEVGGEHAPYIRLPITNQGFRSASNVTIAQSSTVTVMSILVSWSSSSSLSLSSLNSPSVRPGREMLLTLAR